MWKSAYVGVYQLLNWKMHGETLKLTNMNLVDNYLPLNVNLLVCNVVPLQAKKAYGTAEA